MIGVPLVMPNQRARREALAWAAGFYDGEGCITVDKRCRSVRLEICQSGYEIPDTLTRWAASFPNIALRVSGPRTQRGIGVRPMWRVRSGRFEHVQAIVAMMWEHLGQAKRDQYTRAIAVWRDR